jgi:hypothetical protein
MLLYYFNILLLNFNNLLHLFINFLLNESFPLLHLLPKLIVSKKKKYFVDAAIAKNLNGSNEILNHFV